LDGDVAGEGVHGAVDVVVDEVGGGGDVTTVVD